MLQVHRAGTLCVRYPWKHHQPHRPIQTTTCGIAVHLPEGSGGDGHVRPSLLVPIHGRVKGVNYVLPKVVQRLYISAFCQLLHGIKYLDNGSHDDRQIYICEIPYLGKMEV